MTSIPERCEGTIDFYSCAACHSLNWAASPDLKNCIAVDIEPSRFGKFVGRWVWVQTQSFGLIKYFAALGCNARWKISYPPNQEGYRTNLRNYPWPNYARPHYVCNVGVASSSDQSPTKKQKT